MYFGIKGQLAEMGIALIMGAIAACFINLDKFKSFKGAGFEAQLHEAKETLDKAIITADKLKSVVEPIVLFTIHSITHMGRLSSGGKISEKDRIRDYCCKIRDELDIENNEIEYMINQYNLYIIWDTFRSIESVVRYSNCFEETTADLILEGLSSISINGGKNFPSVESIENIFLKAGANAEKMPDDIRNAIDNYAYRIENNESLFEIYE